MIITIDDFCESNNKIELLIELKKKNDHLKFNLFTIPGLCSIQFIEHVKKELPFVDMIPHGFLHPHPRECESWTKEMCILYMAYLQHFGLTKGYKAPGWQISWPMYYVLLDNGYWVSDQHYNDVMRPTNLKVSYPGEHHYHIGHLGGYNANEIEFHLEKILSITEPCNFIKDEI